MSDLLAVFGPAESDEELLDGIADYHPDRVTVLVTDACGDIAGDDCDPSAGPNRRAAGEDRAPYRRDRRRAGGRSLAAERLAL